LTTLPQTPGPSPRCQKAKAEACERYLVRTPTSGLQNTDPHRQVVGIGIGPKVSRKEGVVAPEAVRIYVESKIEPASTIPLDHLIRPEIQDVPTDVVEVGRFRCSGFPRATAETQRQVIQPGTSCGVKFGRCGDGSTGTIGAIVSKGAKRYILSSAHVLARAQGFLIGSPILYPGPTQLPPIANDGTHVNHASMSHDHGRDTNPPADEHPLPTLELFQRARLAEFEALRLDESNFMDAAIAQITQGPFDGSIVGIGRLTSPLPLRALKGMRVMKSGIGTGLSRGKVVDTDFDGRVDFSSGSLMFENQILIEGDKASSFAWEGDSGSLVVTKLVWDLGDDVPRESQTLAVAMVVGFSMPESNSSVATSFCVATDLTLVLNKLGVELTM
jgi:hypothetical protein